MPSIASENTASVNGKSGGGGVGGGGGEGASHSVRTLLHSVGFIENEVELAHSYFAWNAVADSKIESYKVQQSRVPITDVLIKRRSGKKHLMHILHPRNVPAPDV